MINKNLVCELYEQGLSTREVAHNIGCGKTTISSIIKECGISRPRVIRQHVLESKVKRCNPLTKDLIAYLDGLLISDAFLHKPSPRVETSALNQSSASLVWLNQIRDDVNIHGIEAVVLPERRKKSRKNPCYVLNTHRYDQLFFQRKRWYPMDNKCVPQDIDISNPMLLRNWIYGDGTLVHGSLRLCTDSFTIQEIDWLQTRFYGLGYKFGKVFMGLTKIGTEKWRLSLCQKNGLLDFFKQLGEPMDHFAYKWLHKD